MKLFRVSYRRILFATLIIELLPQIRAAADKALSNLLSFHDALPNDTFSRVRLSDSASVRYRDPGPICETTPGIKSLVGFVDLGSEVDDSGTASYFFWFTEARHNADTAPVTLWLNGGPGSDSLLGFFGGPCKVTPDLKTTLNTDAWNEESNMLFLSQPVGVGFSYQSNGGGSPEEHSWQNQSKQAPVIDTTEKAARVVWDILQAFMQALPTLEPAIKTRTIHMWTESYGGHYGPSFFRHFYESNEQIKVGSAPGTSLDLGALGIVSGIVDALAQFPKFPEFVKNNTYNTTLVPDEVSRYMDFACHMPNGCIDQAQQCRQEYLHDKLSPSTIARCAEATYMCRDSVEGPYYFYSGRNMYDIRRPADDPIISQDFVGFLSLASTRTALGIDIIPELTITTEAFEYAAQSDDVYTAFTRAGDYLYPVFLTDLEYLLDHGVRVILMHGDADYIANWLGGEAVSLTLNHSQASLFQATPYAPLVFGNVSTDDDYGKVREQGNLSFVVVRDAGHFVPFSQPALTLELFRRAMAGLDLTTGRGPINSSAAFPFVPDSPLTT